MRQPIRSLTSRKIGLTALAFLFAIFASPAWTAEPEWSLDKDKDGIEVYTRSVAGSGIKEFKGVADVDSGIDDIIALLRDSDRFTAWFPDTSESKLLSRDGDVSYQYSVMATPWPLADRDNVLRSVATRDEKTGVVNITVDAAPDYYPIHEGRVRVQTATGTWKLTPLGDQKTNVAFTMHLEPGGGIPQWLINTRIVATPFEALTNLRGILAGSTAN
jgi:hypothetical protein